VGQKTWTCLRVDNSAMVTHRKVCNMSKVLECCRQKEPKVSNGPTESQPVDDIKNLLIVPASNFFGYTST